MNASEQISIVEGIHREARDCGVLFQVADGQPLQGRTIRLSGRDLVTFGSCSYPGLEFHPALVQGGDERGAALLRHPVLPVARLRFGAALEHDSGDQLQAVATSVGMGTA